MIIKGRVFVFLEVLPPKSEGNAQATKLVSRNDSRFENEKTGLWKEESVSMTVFHTTINTHGSLPLEAVPDARRRNNTEKGVIFGGWGRGMRGSRKGC